jgi:hypothetical protein
MRGRREQPGVAIGRLPGDVAGADDAARAAAIFDHDRLTQQRRQFRGQDAKCQVWRPAGGRGDDRADRSVRIAALTLLGLGGLRQQSGC